MFSPLECRLAVACKFQDDRYYKLFHQYFDLLAQVHSVVETMDGLWMLRVWRAQKFGPESIKERRERQLFHVTQFSFKRYIVPPNPRIGKAIEEFGKEYLIEINVYDEHRADLSGNFVAIQNVHAASTPHREIQILHGGGEAYQRGISTVPVDFEVDAFQNFKRKVESVLENVLYDENFIEFQQPEEVTENRVPEEPQLNIHKDPLPSDLPQ
ncbi:Protection of telomeres protein 1 ssDNA-binding domain-containing protein [Caenorhabditis elegans]|uniref:Protection of telomeres protein 1 ssDNA-binding domain-containing protein n=1 Tax=Caenorhabditis elegans TaxID=6239 RepID=J7SA53_CAEEL|nr:Protection of telomeres protein 1 ssDNA-binding domain-containing protein [Caenorhabditis elegans]CCM09397.1 Protection of telomeres protein 1 ssDNA-binding domain-containing protein [Caenorhabditis elegans]|eukprot:NP_001263736.1 Protection Of Telomeres 1 (Pot1) homolog [Caenorhabditis elegans]